MDIVYHSRLVPEFIVNQDRGRHWRLVCPFEFSVDGLKFTVPVDFWTDFASVPRFLWPMVSPYDLGVGPIPHDFGYFTGYANKDYWDLVFLACMERDKIANWRRQAAYKAVAWFGGKVWDEYRETNVKHLLARGLYANTAKVTNWGIRHHIPPTESIAIMNQQQADWLGAITVQTGI